MSYSLILLGLLSEQPRYGYDLKQTIETRNFAEYVRLSGGGLYYNLRKLQEEGYIAEQTVEHESNYPDRRIFRITGRGQQHFMELLRQTLDDVEGRRTFDPLDSVLAFGSHLTRAEMVARLRYHRDRLRPTIFELTIFVESFRKAAPIVDPYTTLIVEHALTKTQAEIAFLDDAIERIEHDTAYDRTQRTAEMAQPPYSDTAFIEKVGKTWNGFIAKNTAHAKEYERAAGVAWYPYKKAISNADTNADELASAQESYSRDLAAAWQTYTDAVRTDKDATDAQMRQLRQAHQDEADE